MREWARILLLTAASAMLAAAQSDPPGRVGRLNYITGPVSFQPAGVDDWVDANPNRPLTTGDRVWIDDRARAEMHIGSTALRMYSQTELEFLNLDDSNVQIRLTQGTLSVHLKRLDENETFEIDTPTLAFTLLRPGDYRLDMRPDSNVTVIFVRAGEGEVSGGQQAYSVRPGERTLVRADQTYSVSALGPPDEWDSWCLDRDRREDRSVSSRYVSHDMVGWQDLDDNGDWRDVPDYGSVWVPRAMPAGWAPYHNGHWAWIEPWGWTWVDDAPWGFAPFHYGRWAYVGSSWAWVPGPVAARPVYAPALVAWVGGSNFSVGVSVGGGGAAVGWFPLGPREVYAPSYHGSPAYINRVNTSNTVINNVNVTNVNVTNVTYVNRTAPGGVTAIPMSAMAGARSVQQIAVPVQARQLQGAEIVRNAAIAPQRSSVLGRPESNVGRAVQPPAAVQNRAVVAKTPPPPAPVPFARRQQELARDPGRPLDAQSVQKIRAQEPPPARPQIKTVPPSSGAARPTAAPAPPPTPAGRPVPPVREAQPAPQPSNPSPSQRIEQPRNQTPPIRTEQPVPQPKVPTPPARVEEPRTQSPPPRTEQPVPQPRVQAPPARVEQPAVPPRRDVEPSRPVPSPDRRQAEPARPATPPPHPGQQEKRPPDKKDNKKDNKKEDEKRNN
jgi:mannose-6-phosphate isomerase-like protein (cupin superfamily)